MRSKKKDRSLLSSIGNYISSLLKMYKKKISILLSRTKGYLEERTLKIREETGFLRYMKKPIVSTKPEVIHQLRAERLLGILSGIIITLIASGLLWSFYVAFDLVFGLFLGLAVGGVLGIYYGIKLAKERYSLE